MIKKSQITFPESSSQIDELIQEIFTDKIYEGFGTKLKQDDTVLDCGANIGLFTLYAKDIIGWNGRVICIEPMREIYEHLVSNVLPKTRIQTTCLNVGLSDKEEEVEFVYSPERNASSTGDPKRFHVPRRSGDTTKIKVRCTTIDDIIVNQLKTRVDFIKMDIEGMEEKAIRGGRKTIGKYKPRMAISYHFDSKELISLLKEIHPDYEIMDYDYIIYAW